MEAERLKLMITTLSPFKEVAQEEPAISLTTLETSPRKYCRHYPPRPTNTDARIYTDKLKNIDESKVRDFSHEIAMNEWDQPVGYQANCIKTDPKERRGRFLPSPSSDWSKNLPRTPKKVEAIHPQQQRYQNLRVYLDSLKNEARVTGETEFSERILNLSWSVWERLTSLFQARGQWLEVPDACPGSKNNFMYTWSKSEHYLECEIFGTGEIEFFYRNRNTGEVWGDDTTLDQRFSRDILDKASLFIE